MALETLKDEELQPKNFEALRNNRWIVCLEGVDAYLLKSFSGPELLAGQDESEIVLALYNPVASDQNQQFLKWLHEPSTRSCVIKYLDSIGTVVERWSFAAELKKLNFNKLDYADGGMLTTFLTLRVKNFSVNCSAAA